MTIPTAFQPKVITTKQHTVDILPSHPTLSTYSLSSVGVTRYTAGVDAVVGGSGPGAQFDVGWVPDTWPTPTKMRTQQLLASVKVAFYGSSTFGIVFNDAIYDDTNADGERVNRKHGAWAYRIVDLNHPSGSFPLQWGAWNYKIQIKVGDAGTMFVTGLDPTHNYVIWCVPTHPVDSDNMTTEFELTEDVGIGNEDGQFWEVTGFIADTGATFQIDVTGTDVSIVWNVTNHRFMILGDSHTSGFLSVGAGEGSYAFASPTGYFLERVITEVSGAPQATKDTPILNRFAWGDKGALGSYAWNLIETWAEVGTSTEKHFEIMNISQPGHWQTKMGPNLRSFWETNYFPQLFEDYLTKYKHRTKSATAWTDGGDWINLAGSGGAWVPQLCILASFGNDYIQGALELLLNTAGTVTDDQYFQGSDTVKDNFAHNTNPSLLSNLRSEWASLKVFCIGPGSRDVDWGTDLRARIEAGVDGSSVNHYDAINQGAGTDAWLYYQAMADLGTSIDPTAILSTATHPTAAQHEEVRAALQTDFNSLKNS